MERSNNLAIVKRDVFKCNKCGHEWLSQIYTPDNPPVTCAKCKSAYWNRPKKT